MRYESWFCCLLRYRNARIQLHLARSRESSGWAALEQEKGHCGRSGGAVSLDRMHRGRRVRARISASASLSMVRAEAELNVPLHGACGGAPCLSMLISMASDPWPWCLPRAMRLPPQPGAFADATPASASSSILQVSTRSFYFYFSHNSKAKLKKRYLQELWLVNWLCKMQKSTTRTSITRKQSILHQYRNFEKTVLQI
jgi:hypothetical protein